LLEGNNVNLRVVEKEDLPLISEWMANPDFLGECVALWQKSRMDWEKRYDNLKPEEKWFLIEKKDGSKVGFIQHYPMGSYQDLGYALVPNERGKGYCAEAVMLIVDYLFLSKDLVRIQACTDARNVDSQKVLEKAGFQKEGTMRKEEFIRGEWRDRYLYSLLKDEWKGPKILTKTASVM
jgi:RimJ/RimL family protein N-acetyltransferase